MNTGLAKRYTGITSHFCAKNPIKTTVACLEMIEQIPLIEKTKYTRVGIFNDSLNSNLSVVGAFIEMAKTDCEVWYFGKAPLKSWMKPDFVVEEIPENEFELYFASLDIALFCGNSHLNFNQEMFSVMDVLSLHEASNDKFEWQACYVDNPKKMQLPLWVDTFRNPISK